MIKIASGPQIGWVPEDVWENIQKIYNSDEDHGGYEFNIRLDEKCDMYNLYGLSPSSSHWIRCIALNGTGRNAWQKYAEPSEILKDIL